MGNLTVSLLSVCQVTVGKLASAPIYKTGSSASSKRLLALWGGSLTCPDCLTRVCVAPLAADPLPREGVRDQREQQGRHRQAAQVPRGRPQPPPRSGRLRRGGAAQEQHLVSSCSNRSQHWQLLQRFINVDFRYCYIISVTEVAYYCAGSVTEVLLVFQWLRYCWVFFRDSGTDCVSVTEVLLVLFQELRYCRVVSGTEVLPCCFRDWGTACVSGTEALLVLLQGSAVLFQGPCVNFRVPPCCFRDLVLTSGYRRVVSGTLC